MRGKGIARLPALLWVLLAAATAVVGKGAPWDKLLTANRLEADSNKAYVLTEQNGPWMIMAQSFSGEGAEKHAHDLVLEFRQKYKLPAYTHHMKFEFDQTAGRGVNAFGEAPKMKYSRGDKAEETAVLVGDFARVDDPGAQETLRQIKYMHPQTLEAGGDGQSYVSLGAWRDFQQRLLSDKDPRKQKGPMGMAFVTNNPLLPRDYYNPPGLDEFVVKMNEGVEYSLLKCPGRYTVQVAHFTGQVIIDQAQIKAIRNGQKTMESRLAEAANNAHRMTIALREKGYEAYEFHDRYASIVTVGSFQSTGTPRAGGKTEINPDIHKIMKIFGGEALSGPMPMQPTGTMKTKTIADAQGMIPFDVQPIPVEVPRRSVATAFRRE